MVDFPVNVAALKAQIIDAKRLPCFGPTAAIADLLQAFQPWMVPQCAGMYGVAPCVVICTEHQLQGLVLPQTVLQLIAEGVDLRQVLAQDIMAPAPAAIALRELTNLWACLDRMHQGQQELLPIHDDQGHWLGFLSCLALQRLLASEPLLQVRQVQEVMVTELPLLSTTTPLLAAAHRLLQTPPPLFLTPEKISPTTTAWAASLQMLTLWDLFRCYDGDRLSNDDNLLYQGDQTQSFCQVRPTDSLWSVVTQLGEIHGSGAVVLGPEGELLGRITWPEILAAVDPIALHWQTLQLQRRLDKVTQRTEILTSQLAQTEPRPGRSPYRVLLMEDLAMESKILQHLLQPPLGSGLTFQVTQVDSLPQAIAQLTTATYELIIFDLDLLPKGKLEGFRMLQKACPQRPILLLSNDQADQIALAQQCVELGAQDYLLRSLCMGESQTEREVLMRSVRYALETQGVKNRLQQRDQQLEAEIIAKGAIAQQLETTDAQLKVLFEAITDIVFVINPHTWEIKQVTRPHQGRCQGNPNLCQATHQFLLQHRTALMPYLQKAIASPETATAANELLQYEYSLKLTPQAVPQWFVAKLAAIDETQVLWAAHDITPLKNSQQQLLSDQESLAAMVQERTQELRALNGTLNAEIQQRKGIEQELRQGQDFLETLFNLTPALFIVLDHTGRIVRFNPACEQLTGYQWLEVAQQYVWDLFLRSDRDVERVTHLFHNLLQHKQPLTYEVDWRAKSGQIYHLRWSSGVVLDPWGQVRYVIATGLDMSDRQAFETTLKTLNQELESRVEQRTQVLEHIEKNLRRQLAAVDAAVDAIAILQQGEFISVNPAFLALFGYPHLLSLQGHPWHEVLFAPAEQARFQADILPNLEKTKSWQGQAIAQRQDTQLFTAEISLTITSDDDLICVCRDITARNEADLKIRSTEARLRSQYLNFPIPTYTWQHREGNFYLINYNSAAEAANNYRLKDFRHCPSHEIYGSDHAIHQNIYHCFEFKSTFDAELQTTAPNDPNDVLRYFLVTYIYIDPDLVMVHIQDLTQRKQAERELQQSQIFLRQVIDNDPNLIFVKDHQGHFLLANQALADIYGKTVAELIGKRDCDLNPRHQEVEQFDRADRQVIETQAMVVVDEEQLTDIHGTVHYFRTVKVPLQLPGDRTPCRILGVASEMTQQRRAKQELENALNQERELNYLKTRFIDTASHEFRTPLTVILGAAQMLDAYSEHLSPERRSQYLRNIQDSVIRLRQLIDDVLTMSRLEAGKLRCQRQPIDIIALCQDLLTEFKVGLGKQHHIVFETAGAIASPLNLDPNLIQHILSNLLSNACKYSAPGTTITLEVIGDEAQLTLTITDQGIGIPAEDWPHLFGSFYRASNTQNIPGTGLGLNIVKEYVLLHGGTINFSSQLGRGSQFVVTIPLEA
ncbi:PAS domain S-box protein [Picosynechococcus sp. NKBG15041c]|uniref:PAS domain S-box protein n=1 Tax=Picosynechococcus sp. NKBG15041c TaxID=1407650 RepID=UPI0003FE2B32|nr:PAS domain S-box protein [Picosynechococcus sp. NKBG15041c]